MNKVVALNPSVASPFILRWKLRLRAFWILSVAIFVPLLILYIFQVNGMTEDSFLVSGYEKKISDLYHGNKNLEIGFSQTNSLASLEILLNEFNYEKVEKVHYIQILDGTMAAK